MGHISALIQDITLLALTSSKLFFLASKMQPAVFGTIAATQKNFFKWCHLSVKYKKLFEKVCGKSKNPFSVPRNFPDSRKLQQFSD